MDHKVIVFLRCDINSDNDHIDLQKFVNPGAVCITFPM